MATSGLTLAVLLFLLLVYLPGNLTLLVAGRKQQNRTAPISIFYGAFDLMAVLGAFWFLALINKSDILQRFTATLATVTEGKGSMDLTAVSAVFVSCYILAYVIGFVELFLVTGFYAPSKWAHSLFNQENFDLDHIINSVKYVYIVVREIFARCYSAADYSNKVWLKPTDSILDTFICFRRAGKRPHLAITLKNGISITGECLRFSWNGKESILIADTDNPCQLSWVALDETTSVKFLNLTFLDAEEKFKKETEKCLKENRKNRQILNNLVLGYGDEMYNKYKGLEKQQ